MKGCFISTALLLDLKVNILISLIEYEIRIKSSLMSFIKTGPGASGDLKVPLVPHC